MIMCCEEYRDRIGRFLDDELASDVRADVSEHLQACAACRLELENLQELTSAIPNLADAGVPSSLWTSIETSLQTAPDRPSPRTATRFPLHRSRRWALAASLVFVVGLGFLGTNLMSRSARASEIDFGVLLDALPLDAQLAFGKFLALYGAETGSALEAKKFAPALDFETPPTLPGGFRLESVYLLQFGNRPGVAASYRRGNDFLATIFHPPVEQENFGTHKDYPCAIGKHRGHKVEVGSWKMIHLTDPTTCHCVLSQLDEATELPAIMAAVAPLAAAGPPHNHGE